MAATNQFWVYTTAPAYEWFTETTHLQSLPDPRPAHISRHHDPGAAGPRRLVTTQAATKTVAPLSVVLTASPRARPCPASAASPPAR